MKSTALIFMAATINSTSAMAATPITGRWLTADGAAVVDIGPCGADICGRVSRIITVPPGGSRVNVNNP